MDRLRPWVVPAWATLLGLLLLGPALAPGYVLSYDMVWVPDLAIRPDFLGVGTGLPRAVPSDAVVAVLDEVIPGMLLQKLVLLGSLVAVGTGTATLLVRLTSGFRPGLGAQLLAASVAVWNPFTVERLAIGHWPVLLGYGALPWVVLAARRHRLRRGVGPLLVLLPVASLSASAGLASAVAVLVTGWGRARHRGNALLAALVLAVNAPWIVSGLLHVQDATTDPAGATAFAARSEGPLPVPLTALGLGGVWNSEVVPVTRDGPFAVVSLLVLLGLAAAGARSFWSSTSRRDAGALLAMWGCGYGVALLGWLAPGTLEWFVEAVPGAGLLRDTSRLLGLCVPLVAVLAAHGARRAVSWLRDPDQRTFVGGVLALVPLSLMPDAAWGVGGRVTAVSYPASYEATREAVGSGKDDAVLLLPFSSYRAPTWNEGRKVLDPVGRYLRPDFVANDELIVSGVVVEGEDPRGTAVRAALEAATPDLRRQRLLDLGVGWAVVDGSAPDEAVEVAGTLVASTGDLETLRFGRAAPVPVSPAWWVAMGVAWLCFVGPPVVWLTWLLGRRTRRDVTHA